MSYTLVDFKNIILNGFNYTLPPDTLKIITELSREVGSPNYIKTPNFTKKKEAEPKQPKSQPTTNSQHTNNSNIIDASWESIRNFKTTKIEKKEGVDAKISLIRSHINKLSNSNYLDIRIKILAVMDELTEIEINSIGVILFDIASTNRFYSKMYADLYSELIIKYSSMKEVLQENVSKFSEIFNNIEYIDPSVDYDKFCKINKDNEKRKALSAFFLNLMINNIISKEEFISIFKKILQTIYSLISEENKKNEVDELSENMVLLFNAELCKNTKHLIEGLTIMEIINKIATSKAKDYKSLTNKTIFKFMDMIES